MTNDDPKRKTISLYDLTSGDNPGARLQKLCIQQGSSVDDNLARLTKLWDGIAECTNSSKRCKCECDLNTARNSELDIHRAIRSTDAQLTRIIAEIAKLVKDSSDSRVRDACLDTIAILSGIYKEGNNTGATSSLVDMFVKQLFEAMGDQNILVQSAAAMCMARIVESAATHPLSSFQMICPRICKLLSNSSFLAKASLLPVVSSLSQAGAIAPQSLDSLLESIHGCLGSTDWLTRKAAAETLTALASHSSNLLKDKTDSTITLLENCRSDEFLTVCKSVAEALQLWKKISGKRVDGALEESKISFGHEQLGSEKTGEKRCDLAVLMRKETFDGSTLSLSSATKEKGGPPEKEAVVMLNKAAETDDQSEGSAIQRQLLQLKRQQTILINMLQEFIGSSYDSMVTLEGKFKGLERIVEDMGRDLSTAGFGKYQSFANYNSTGKYVAKIIRERMMLNPDIPPHVAASRNGQAGPRSPRSEQHENEQVGNGRRGWDKKSYGTTRFGESPAVTCVWKASKGEATVGAGEDGAVTRPTPIAAVPEAGAMGDEKNKALYATTYRKALHSLHAGDINSAYAEVFGLGDQRLVKFLMGQTGPTISRMSNENANEALKFIAMFLMDQNLYGMCVSWIQQLVGVLLQRGSETFEVPMDLRDDVVFKFEQACPTPNPLVDQLASAWDL